MCGVLRETAHHIQLYAQDKGHSSALGTYLTVIEVLMQKGASIAIDPEVCCALKAAAVHHQSAINITTARL